MKLFMLWFLLILYPALVAADFVISDAKKLELRENIKIYSFRIDSQVTSRFAHNVITSSGVNHANISKEVFFEVELPKTAFITNFSMTIDGKTYVGTVKEKEIAQKQYQEAVRQGKSAGIVKASGRKMETFKVSVNIASASKVTFELTYEELLKRKLGMYEMFIRVKPNQLVDHFQINVNIFETQGITSLDAEGTFMTNELMQTLDVSFSGNTGHVSFKPTVDDQRSCPECPTTRLDGELIIKYDVERAHSAGDIQVVNGYFVHFFAPENLPRVPKTVVFVIDISGSMMGRKIQQTKEALLKISEDISEDDYFDFIIFNSNIKLWKKSLVKATKKNIAASKAFVSELNAAGGTNINEAVLSAVQLLDEGHSNKTFPATSVSIIILLTDGSPNVGVTNLAAIRANVKQAIGGRFTLSLYCLGFGQSLDYNFLETLALENGGIARRIYEDSDSALQLQGFYEEVAKPLLSGIQMQYPEAAVSDVTKQSFKHYYGGSEIVVAGRVVDNNLISLPSAVTAQGATSHLNFSLEGKVEDTLRQQYIFGKYTERLWAYLTVQQLLEQLFAAEGDEKENLKTKATELSLKYNFVTPLTSLVVTKPEDEAKSTALVADKLTEALRTTEAAPEKPARPTHQRVGSSPSFAEGDPHFVIQLPNKNETFCFNVQQKPGVILNLVNDPVTGITVNGELESTIYASTASTSQNTYIGKLGIVSKKLDVKMEVTLHVIKVFNGQQKMIFHWKEMRNLTQQSFSLSILKGKRLTVSIGDDASFVIVLHRARKMHLKHRDYLGIYTLDSHQLSENTHGLLGQFYHDMEFEIFDIHPTSDPGKTDATLAIKGNKIAVTGKWRKNFRTNSRDGVAIFCWFVAGNGKGLIDGNERDYIVSSLFGHIN
ncbi:inter-alpha-trypsin inhibitor heavy chain H3-like isoform X2 [Rhinatrema bivittatum]|uniref:inter-alpha-trypsin inhibitor heavy chain H3-like isoform X2 n=1 Tax=Rhinatrema bivittatum TaxID=194408 RepID=UPI00112AA2F2|nr:inter-alpha-trypsin inhibitor heavy chain H3-like isoform X2 [Rhinatrema bivittatum]XP_029455292.1 inter-alpha-trypsin inhibitor heavy chain H3-like isoform X2 [Rhinatrema bivittatum]